MRIAVAGGSGFLGRHVVEALRRDGHSVRVLARRVDPTEDREGLTHRAVDVGASPLPSDALEGCDALVNLVGIKAARGADDFTRAHVDAVDHLIEAARGAGIERFIHVSVAQSPDATGAYAQTKQEGEARARSSGLATTVLRPGLIYGPGDDALRNLVRMVRLAPLVPVPMGAGGPLPAIDVLDVAAAVSAAVQRPQTAGESIDLVGPEVLDLRTLVRRVARALDLPTIIPPLPDALARLGAAVMERVLPDPLLSRSQLSMLTLGLPGDPSHAREQLGLEPRALGHERIAAIAADVPDLLPSVRLVTGTEHRQWLAGFAGGRPPWPWVLVLALGVMLSLPPLLPEVFVRMAAVNVVFVALLLGLGRGMWTSLLRPRLGTVGLGIVAAMVLYVGADLFMAGLRLSWPDLAAQVQTVYAWSDTAPLPLRLGLIGPIVFGEDLLWRGALTLPLAARFGAVPGCLLAGSAFALAHLTTGPPLLLLAALAMGALWSAMAIRTRSLVPVVVCHLTWDLLVMFVRPL